MYALRTYFFRLCLVGNVLLEFWFVFLKVQNYLHEIIMLLKKWVRDCRFVFTTAQTHRNSHVNYNFTILLPFPRTDLRTSAWSYFIHLFSFDFLFDVDIFEFIRKYFCDKQDQILFTYLNFCWLIVLLSALFHLNCSCGGYITKFYTQ